MNRFHDIDDLADFIEDYFGARVTLHSVSPSKLQIRFSLYDSFVFIAGLAPQTFTFGMALQLPANTSQSVLLGRSFSLNNDPDSIAESLDLADEYCRLRLPDKFLSVYDTP